jgi:putative phage-type endonuclease
MTTPRHDPLLVLPRGNYGKNRKHWHAARHAGITATDAAVILGVSPYASPLSLFIDKTTPAPDGDVYLNESAEWGNLLEDVVARKWAKQNKQAGIGIIAPCPGILAHPDHPWLLATIDRYIVPRRGAEPTSVLEVKTTTSDWPENGDLPDRIVVQVQVQLAVTGLDHAYVAALHLGRGKKYREWLVQRDDYLIEQIIAACDEFRFAVLLNEPPAPIGHDADDDALKTLYPGNYVTAPVTIDDISASLRRGLVEKRDRLEQEIKELDQRVKAEMRDATEAINADGEVLFTWRPSTSMRLDQAALKNEHPDLVDQYLVPSITRRFLSKTPKASKK